METAPGNSGGIETASRGGTGQRFTPRGKASPRWRGWALAVLFLAAMLGGFAAEAKEKRPQRELSGTVLDGEDNPINGAAVTLTDLSTGKQNATYTDREGRYLFADLEVTRDYEVQATYEGVTSRTRKLSQFDPRSRIVFHLRIPPEEEGP